MASVWSYEGKRVIVRGGGGAGMGAVTVRELDHRSTPEEQACPFIFLDSGAASAITGENILTDGGTMGAMTVGTLDIPVFGFPE